MRLTILNRWNGSRMRVDVDPAESVDEIVETAEEAWGQRDGMVLRDGYSLLDPDEVAGSCISDGDVVEVLPDPFECRAGVPGIRRDGRPGAVRRVRGRGAARAPTDGQIYGLALGSSERVKTTGRMGASADVLFVQNAMAAILDAADRSSSHGGLAGRVETDEKGEYTVVTGIGRSEVGMFFPSEGTEASDAIVGVFREVCGTGVLVVVDPVACELAVYMVEDGGVRLAAALMEERSHPDRMAGAHLLLGDPLA